MTIKRLIEILNALTDDAVSEDTELVIDIPDEIGSDEYYVAGVSIFNNDSVHIITVEKELIDPQESEGI